MLRALFLTTTSDLETAAVALEALTQFNTLWLAQHEAPPLRRSGVIWIPPPTCVQFCEQDWPTIPIVLERGRAPCNALAPWRAAELRKRGYPLATAFPMIVPGPPPPAPTQMHAVVTRDGTLAGLEDPSAELGMTPMSQREFVSLARAHLRLLSPRCTHWR